MSIMNTNIIYRVQDDLFDSIDDIQYGDYNYTDRNPKHSNENAWFWVPVGGRYMRSDEY